MTCLTLTIKEDRRLEIRCAAPEIREDRNLTPDDLIKLDLWSNSYRNAIETDAEPDVLIALGREMFILPPSV